MPAINAPDRHQLTFMNTLDDLVAADHPVRLLDQLIDHIISADPAFFDHLAPQESAGRKGYPAASLLKLLFYGYIHGISSSRKLQTEAERNIEVIWLLSTLKPSYKTIADYRRDHPEQIECINRQVTCFLADNGWIEGKRVAIDGARIKAYTSWDMPDEAHLSQRIEQAQQRLEQWLERLALNDALEDAAEELEQLPPEGESEIMQQIGCLHRHIEKLEAARDRLADSEAKRLPLSDPEARAMRAPHGSSPPAYNLQAGVDSAYGMIVGTSVVNEANDFQQLQPMHQLLEDRLGRPVDELLADKGYADLGDIKRIQTETSTHCYIPENDTAMRNRKVSFHYQPEEDQYRCSAGRTLEPIAKERYYRDKQAYCDIYRGTNCQSCPMQSACTSAADGVRQLRVFHGAEWRHCYKQQLASRYGKARTRERKSIVEHVFGTVRYMMGQIPLKLRGLRKVQTEIDLYAGGYNLKRWFGLGTFKELKNEITSWSSKLNLQPV
jgi:transposase